MGTDDLLVVRLGFGRGHEVTSPDETGPPTRYLMAWMPAMSFCLSLTGGPIKGDVSGMGLGTTPSNNSGGGANTEGRPSGWGPSTNSTYLRPTRPLSQPKSAIWRSFPVVSSASRMLVLLKRRESKYSFYKISIYFRAASYDLFVNVRTQSNTSPNALSHYSTFLLFCLYSAYVQIKIAPSRA